MRVPITVDLHISNFNYPGVGPDQEFEKILEITDTMERSGYSSVSFMDHLHQIEAVGPQDWYMLEGSTLLAAIAARTSKLTMGLLVGSVTYRNPALAAKITTTIDIISGGRAWHGIGAGWMEDEHRSYGYEFPSLRTRHQMEQEAIQIVRSMFRGEGRAEKFEGEHFQIDEPYNNPRPIHGDIPLLIGGSGERVALRIVAKHGDGCNFFGPPPRVKHLLEVLQQHCDEVGRDFSEITKTTLGSVMIAPTHEAAQAIVQRAIERGLPAERANAAVWGDPDEVGEKLQAFKDVGVEGVCFTLADPSDLEAVELAGKAGAKVFGSVPTAA